MATETKIPFSRCLSNATPALCALLVVAIGSWVASYVDMDGVDWLKLKIQVPFNVGGKTEHLGTRIGWIASLFIYYTSFAIVMWCSIKIMLKSLPKGRFFYNASIFFLLSLVALGCRYIFSFEHISVGLIIDMINEFLKDSMNLLITADYCSMFGIVFLIAAACAILFSKKDMTETQTLHTTEQGQDLMLLLYVGSLFLVAGTLEIKTCMDCLVAHVLPIDDIKKATALINSLTPAEFDKLSALHKVIKDVADNTRIFSGSVYTALLIAMYLPAALIIEGRLRVLGAPAPGDQAFALSPAIKRLLNLVAAIAPLVVGTSLDFISKITA